MLAGLNTSWGFADDDGLRGDVALAARPRGAAATTALVAATSRSSLVVARGAALDSEGLVTGSGLSPACSVVSTLAARQTASATFAQKASAYGMPGVRVDGNDALAVFQVVHSATERARRGEGPTLVECLTYRIGAHSSSDDPTRYRDEAEVEAWRKRDPIARLGAHLRNTGALSAVDEQALDASLEAEIAEAIRATEAQPPLSRESLIDDVYATRPLHLESQRDELLRYAPSRANPTEHHGSE